MKTTFRVWAPQARRMELALSGRTVAMAAEDDGWWRAEVDQALAGSDYGFCIDGGELRPDPRSPWQPAGVHGPSRTLDPDAFAWSDQDFRPPSFADGVVYELHVGTFTPEGTFESAIDRLDHLVELGVTHLELMPVGAFPDGRGWGYDGVDLYAPQASYGGPLGFKRLVDACHRRGLAVLLDVVYNHLGPCGNYLGQFGPYFTDRYRTPWGSAVNLDDADSDEVRRFFIDNALYWIREFHLDGLRLDAVHALMDTSAVHFLEELAASVHDLGATLGRPVVVVAESDLNDPRLVRSEDAGGYGLDAMWADGFHHALHVALTGERTGYYHDFRGLESLARALGRGLVYEGQRSPHRRRKHGRPLEGVSGRRLVSFLQNHDQIGNRARGERIGHLAGSEAAKAGAALMLLGPFVPLLFQGEEWAASTPFPYFTDHPDPELAQAVRDGRRREFAAFGWRPEDVPDPQAPETFASARLLWDECQQAPHADVLAWYRALIRLRRSLASLRDGRFDLARVRFDEQAGWLLLEREGVQIACQLAAIPARVPLPTPAGELCLASQPGVRREGRELMMPPHSAAILTW